MTKQAACEVHMVDGEPVRVQGHLEPEDQEAFASLIRAAKAHVKALGPQPCKARWCKHLAEDHDHGPACSKACACGQGTRGHLWLQGASA